LQLSSLLELHLAATGGPRGDSTFRFARRESGRGTPTSAATARASSPTPRFSTSASASPSAAWTTFLIPRRSEVHSDCSALRQRRVIRTYVQSVSDATSTCVPNTNYIEISSRQLHGIVRVRGSVERHMAEPTEGSVFSDGKSVSSNCIPQCDAQATGHEGRVVSHLTLDISPADLKISRMESSSTSHGRFPTKTVSHPSGRTPTSPPNDLRSGFSKPSCHTRCDPQRSQRNATRNDSVSESMIPVSSTIARNSATPIRPSRWPLPAPFASKT